LRGVEDKVGEAMTFWGIGQVYSDLGEKQKALDYYNQSLPLLRLVGDKVGEARTLQQQLNALDYRRYQILKGQRGKKETEELNAIPKQIESLLTQLDEVQAQIRQKNSSYSCITQPRGCTLNLQQIQQQVLDDNTLLLEYSLGEDRSYL